MAIGGPGESFSELHRSRLGHTSGVNSATATTTWLVTTDEIEDNPVGALATNKVPSGMPHPWEPLATAQDYTVNDRIAYKKWICTVTYKTLGGVGPDDRQGTASRWRLSVRGVSMTEHILEEVPFGVRGRVRSGGLIPQRTDPDSPRRLIGPNVYRKPKKGVNGAPDENSTHHVGSIDLVQSLLRRGIGFDVEQPAFAMIFTREQPNFDFAKVPGIVEHYKKINSSPIFGCDPGRLLFQDFGVDEMPGTWNPEAQQNIPGLIYRISLGFLCNHIEWSPVGMVHTYTDPATGGFGFVTKSGEVNPTPIVDEFDVITRTDFNLLVRALL